MSETQKTVRQGGSRVDFKTIGRDLRKQCGMILLLAASIAMLAFVFRMHSHRDTYTIEATYAVTNKQSGNSIARNLNNAQNVAAQFSQVINSTILQRRIREDLGDFIKPGRTTAEVIPQTNLISLRTSSSSVQSAFFTLKSFMANYHTVTDFVLGDMRMTVLVQPEVPLSPDQNFHPYRDMGKVFLYSFLALMLAAAFLSYLKDTVRDGIDMETKLNSRYLGAICHENKYRTLKSKFIHPEEPLLMTSPVVSFAFAESIMKITRKLESQMENAQVKSLIVTSCRENEGKSTVAANIALALARNGRRVVLVDMDLRKPAQHRIFGSMLGDDDTLIRELIKDRLYLIPDLQRLDSSLEEILDDKLKAFLAYLEGQFSYVILDTPPMESIADTETIASAADASLCVVREHTTLVRDINEMLETLSCYRAQPIGCILNDAYSSWRENLGGYEYRRRYGYGKGYDYYG